MAKRRRRIAARKRNRKSHPAETHLGKIFSLKMLDRGCQDQCHGCQDEGTCLCSPSDSCLHKMWAWTNACRPHCSKYVTPGMCATSVSPAWLSLILTILKKSCSWKHWGHYCIIWLKKHPQGSDGTIRVVIGWLSLVLSFMLSLVLSFKLSLVLAFMLSLVLTSDQCTWPWPCTWSRCWTTI